MRIVVRWAQIGSMEAAVPGDTHHTPEGAAYSDPSTVSARQGEVIVDGPDGVAVAMTPDAAAETSDRLLHASTQAMGQRVEAKRRKDEAHS